MPVSTIVVPKLNEAGIYRISKDLDREMKLASSEDGTFDEEDCLLEPSLDLIKDAMEESSCLMRKSIEDSSFSFLSCFIKSNSDLYFVGFPSFFSFCVAQPNSVRKLNLNFVVLALSYNQYVSLNPRHKSTVNPLTDIKITRQCNRKMNKNSTKNGKKETKKRITAVKKAWERT